MQARLPTDDGTLKNFRGFELLSYAQCTGERDDELPRAFGTLADDAKGGPAQKLVVLPDGYPYFKDPGSFLAVVSKFRDTGLLPGTPVQDCGALPQNAVAPVCDRFYERSSGKLCRMRGGRCEAAGPPIAERDKRDDLCVVAVRGTVPSSVSNWLVDANIEQAPLRGLCADGCRAHAGFKYAAEKLLPPVTEALKEYGCRDVVFTGHSLGGAVATLMGYSVQKGGDFRVDGAYTYEAPRPGDANLARAMDADGFDVVRVTHEGDPVPVLPWYDPLGRRYAHPGREVFYGKTGLRADCLSADCERDAQACACSEGWFKRGLPLDAAAHTDFTKTPLDWGEANACPWPQLPSAPLQKLVVR